MPIKSPLITLLLIVTFQTEIILGQNWYRQQRRQSPVPQTYYAFYEKPTYASYAESVPKNPYVLYEPTSPKSYYEEKQHRPESHTINEESEPNYSNTQNEDIVGQTYSQYDESVPNYSFSHNEEQRPETSYSGYEENSPKYYNSRYDEPTQTSSYSQNEPTPKPLSTTRLEPAPEKSYAQHPVADLLLKSVAPNYVPKTPNDIFDFLRDSYPLPNGKRSWYLWVEFGFYVPTAGEFRHNIFINTYIILVFCDNTQMAKV